MRRRTLILIASGVVILAGVGTGAAWWIVHRKTPDVHNGTKLPFTFTSDSTTTSTGTSGSTGGTRPRAHPFGPSWPVYGLSDARTRDASSDSTVHPPFHVVWAEAAGFLEYPPVYAKGVLYIYSNSGSVFARNVFDGKLLWSRRLLKGGTLGPGSPAVSKGVVYVGARN